MVGAPCTTGLGPRDDPGLGALAHGALVDLKESRGLLQGQCAQWTRIIGHVLGMAGRGAHMRHQV